MTVRMGPGGPDVCIAEGCSAERRDAPDDDVYYCEECHQAESARSRARAYVHLGESGAAYEVRCFDCADVRFETVAEGEEPDRDCEHCQSSNTKTTLIMN